MLITKDIKKQKCQKSAWNKFHKDECKTLRNVPQMMAQHLLAHRLMFWQQKGYITTKQGKAIERMETHFNEYSKGEESATRIFDVAMAVRKETGNKVGLGLVWRMVPCVRLFFFLSPPPPGALGVLILQTKLRSGYVLTLFPFQ